MKTAHWIACVLLIFSVGCASILSKSSYPVNINSAPSGVKIIVEDERGNEIFTGQTPTIVTLSASRGFFRPAQYTIKTRHGGQETTAVLKATLDGWYLGNIIFGGLLGILIIDPATGAMWRLDDEFAFRLNDSQTRAPSDEAQLKIATLDQVLETYRLHLKRVR